MLDNLAFIAFVGSVFLFKYSQNCYDRDKLADYVKKGGSLRLGIPHEALTARGVVIQKIAKVLIITFGVLLVIIIWNYHKLGPYI